MNASATLLITCCTVFLAQLGMSIYLPALPEIAGHLHAGPAQVAWGLSIYLVGMALPMLLWGSLAQRIGRKPVLLAALGLYGAANLALPLGSTLESFLLLRLIQGVGASGISVMARVLIRDSFRGDLLAKALSWISISFVVALGIGQYLGSIIQVTLGWQAIFYLLGITCLLMAMIVFRVNFATLEEAQTNASAWLIYRRILIHRAFLLPALAGGLGYGVIIAFNTAAPLILQGPFNWSTVDYGLLGWPISAAYFLGALVVNRFVLRTGQHRLMTLGVVLVMAGCGVMLLGSLTASSIALMLWLPYCVAVFGQSLNYPISLSRANDGAPIAGAYAMALSGFIHQLMAAMIGAIASLVASPSAWPLALLCSLLAVGAMLCVTFTPTRVSP
ncbi:MULTISPECIES: MFS transporter [Pseudomonas]|uniref:MFS transporter n=2 Tax=Pseudomonas TaxID=286 RepID=A0A2C5VEC1_PSEPU|nr:MULTISPECIES: MFS transporter [Pseudomonas]MBY8957751.1 MFS transporter [Pseudomonas sp. MIS38]PHH42909.1 MFS transporter [Pseudomonas putida]QBR30728.1 MFS transporter [Pseudomonas sp. S150]QBX40306.1 MFS transporter [Pseudomonas fluorescens]UZT94237.1 MFS transporter [Pseudomonas koreensis]